MWRSIGAGVTVSEVNPVYSSLPVACFTKLLKSCVSQCFLNSKIKENRIDVIASFGEGAGYM